MDTLSTRYGVRELTISDAQLRLNDKPLFLKGLNWHEETAAHGRAMTPAEYDRELGHLTTLGANFIRTASTTATRTSTTGRTNTAYW